MKKNLPVLGFRILNHPGCSGSLYHLPYPYTILAPGGLLCGNFQSSALITDVTHNTDALAVNPFCVVESLYVCGCVRMINEHSRRPLKKYDIHERTVRTFVVFLSLQSDYTGQVFATSIHGNIWFY